MNGGRRVSTIGLPDVPDAPVDRRRGKPQGGESVDAAGVVGLLPSGATVGVSGDEPSTVSTAPDLYRTILADPPWPVHSMRRANVLRGDHYATMTLDEIKALPVGRLARDDAHLYCWAVLPMMAEAFDVVRAWGFAPVTMLTWCKPGPGLGGGYRGNTEHLIVARRGESFYNPTCSKCRGRARGANKCSCDEPEWRYRGERTVYTRQFSDVAEGTWYVASRREHSAKPDLFADLIERMSPGPYLELFARRNRLGWDTWGNESLNHVEMPI